jgi:hypothetical protein
VLLIAAATLGLIATAFGPESKARSMAMACRVARM